MGVGSDSYQLGARTKLASSGISTGATGRSCAEDLENIPASAKTVEIKDVLSGTMPNSPRPG
jgi:hypothetical protein